MTTPLSRVIFLFYFFILAIQIPCNSWAMEKIQGGQASSSSSLRIEEIDDDIDVSRSALIPRLPARATHVENIDVSHFKTMPFKLGFEFQVGTLCKWALLNNNLQKKPLFLVTDHKTKRKLWHLVIDTSDIEFVTEPFSDEELHYLERCMDSILLSFNILLRCLTEHQQISFGLWGKQMEAPLNELGFLLDNIEIYDLVKDKELVKESPDWKPEFSPQITIQHPLEYTIPLSFSLFGFNSNYMLTFCASLPYRDVLIAMREIVNAERFDKVISGYCSKLGGLVFLHALTLVQMTPEGDDDDTKLLSETLTCLNRYHQIDPKIKLALMSRRPISSMIKDFRVEGDYSENFKGAMKLNHSFRKIFKVQKLFARTNYAEQFFDNQSGQARPLRSFLPLFEETFLEKNRVAIEALLDQGVVSTVMLRNLRRDVLTEDLQPVAQLSHLYYNAAINSVTLPQKRYNISLDNPGVSSLQSIYDALSPPWFLDKDNSMGAYKHDIHYEDKKYGEAVVEFRAISRVGPYFLQKVGRATEAKSPFLTIPNAQLKKDAIALFEYLKQFGKPQDFKDFALGMTYAPQKY